jgi:nucleoside-diphosphate-sugar epimerase
MGPPAVLPESSDKIHETTIVIYQILSGGPIPAESAKTRFVDVRDVARLLVWTIANPEKATNERYLAIGGAYSNQDIADILNEAYPDRNLEKGTPGNGQPRDYGFPAGDVSFDNSKAVKATGQDWTRFDKTVLDGAKVFEKFL